MGTPYHNGAMYGNVFYCLLPYVEMGPIFESTHITGSFPGSGYLDYYGWFNGGGTAWNWANMPIYKRVKLYECPSDPSLPYCKDSGWAYTSYSANGQVFGNPGPNGGIVTYDEATPGVGSNAAWVPKANTQAYPKTPDTFEDGGAQTVVFTEAYAQCGPGGGSADSPCGKYWARVWDGSYDATFVAYALSNHQTDPLTGSKLYVMAPDYWVTNPTNAASTVPPGIKFQAQPNPWRVFCNPFLASTGHPGGINVALADGSSRVVAKTIEPATWWAVLTPNAKDRPGPDW